MNKTNIKYALLIAACMVFMIGSYMLKEALYAGVREQKINSFETYMNHKQEIEKMYTNRYVDVLKEQKQILIGKNKNEVENGYYDIKIEEGFSHCLYINKLYKDKFNKNELIDKQYLKELLNSVNELFDMKLEEKSVNELENLISAKYEALRKVENVDNMNQKTEEIVKVQKFNIKTEYIDSMLKITISEV